MAEDSADVTSEITPEEFEGKETPKTESSPVEEAKVETKAEKPEAEAEKPKETAETEDTETEGEAEKPEEVEKPAEETETKPPGKAEERKAQLNSEIRDLVAQRNTLKSEVEKVNAEAYQPATEADLVDQGLSATDAKVEALRQAIEVKDFNDKVVDAQLTLSSEADRVLREFSIFNSESSDYDKELAQEASELMEAQLEKDPNTGQIIGSRISPYQLYKTLAKAASSSQVKGQLKGQQDTEQMLASADTASSTAPAKKAVDPVIALWQEED